MTPGRIAERDFGTKHRYTTYPTAWGSTLAQKALTHVGGTSLFHPSAGSEYDIIAGYDDQGTADTHVCVYDTTWIDMTRKVTALVNATPAATTKSVVLKTCKENTYDFSGVQGANSLAGWIAIATGHTGLDAFTIDTNTTCVAGVMTITTLDNYLGTDGLNFATDQVVELYPSIGSYYFTRNLGTTPILNWMPTETQAKVMMQSTDSSAAPVAKLPILFMKKAERLLDGIRVPGHAGPSALAAGWYAEGGGGLSTLFAKWGDPLTHVSITPSSGAQAAVSSGKYAASSWLDIGWTVSNEGTYVPPASNIYLIRHAIFTVVAEYDGYQSSDPIAYGFASNGDYTHMGIAFTFDFNTARMPKNITALSIYVWTSPFTQYTTNDASILGVYAADAAVGPKDMTLAIRILTNTANATTGVLTVTPTYDLTRVRPYRLAYKWQTDYDRQDGSNLYDALGHAYVEQRSTFNSRYSLLVGQKRGSSVVVDDGDNTLRMTPVNGNGNVEEDNFPDVPVDSYGGKLRTTLTSRGTLLGITQVNNIILAMKTQEIEKIDLYSGFQQPVAADVYAPRSVITTPFGAVWAGKRAIYIWREGEGSWEVLNSQWQNMYDGTLRATNGTQYITDAQKLAIIAGYDPTYYEVWFHAQCADDAGTGTEYLCFRYSFMTKHWNVRKLNIGSYAAVKWFNKRNDGLTIGYSTGLLDYPNKTGSYVYHDDVPYADTNPSKGVETSGKMILGEIYSLQQPTAPIDIKVDASVSGTGRTNLYFYANRETTPFETKSQIAGERPVARSVPNHGRLESLAVAFDHSSADQSTITKVDISEIDVGFSDVIPGDR